LAAVLACGVVLAACGGSSSPKAVSSTSPTTAATTPSSAGGANTAALQAFRSCLTQHGVTLPTFTPRTTTPGATTPAAGTSGSGSGTGAGRGFGGGGGLNAVFNNSADAAAVQACQNLLPPGYLAQQQARQNQLAAFDSCMADHGVTITTTPAGTSPTSIDTTSAAYKTCSPLLPTRPAAGSTTTTTAP